MKWLKRIFNKKKKMDLTEKTIPELKEELQKSDFMWTKGDKMGNAERFEDIVSDESTGMNFVTFQGGGRINLELLDEYMDKFPAAKVNLNSLNPQTQDPILNVAQIEQPVKPQQAKNVVSSVEVEESPIYTLLKKQKENWVNVNISLNLNLPPKSLYGVLISSFDDADSEITNYITEGIDIEDIRAALAESISSYYGSTKKSTSKSKDDKKLANSTEKDGE